MTPDHRVAAAATLAAVTVLATVRVLGAQSPTPPLGPADGASSWIGDWSPLAPMLDDGFASLGASGATPFVLGQAPRLGLFWLGANPAALVSELPAAGEEFRASSGSTSGSYHRPLEPAQLDTREVSASGWQPVDAGRGAAIGRVTLGLADEEQTRSALTAQPYDGSPMLPIDTTVANESGSRVTLEGALAWRLGAWSAGLGTGYDVMNSNTDRSPFARLDRVSSPAVSLGLVRPLWSTPVRAGIYGRWRQRTEVLSATPAGATGEVYPLLGFQDVEPIDVNTISYLRRLLRRGAAVGLQAGASASWTVFAELRELSEQQSTQRTVNPPTDRWTARGGAVGAAWQGRLPLIPLHLAAVGWYARLDTRAWRSDLATAFFDGQIARTELVVQTASTWRDSTWRLGVRAGTDGDRLDRNDAVAGVYTSEVRWSPNLASELAWRSPHAELALGTALVRQTPMVVVPMAESLDSLFQRVFAPELAVDATPATEWMLGARASFPTPIGSVWAALERDALSPGTSETGRLFGPGGGRQAWRLGIGVRR